MSPGILRAAARTINATMFGVLPAGTLLPVGDRRPDPMPRWYVHERGSLLLYEMPTTPGNRDSEYMQNREKLLFQVKGPRVPYFSSMIHQYI